MFNDELLKYREKLSDNIDIVKNIKVNNGPKETMDIILNPRNERELRIANGIVDSFINMGSLYEASYYGYVKYNEEDCMILDLFVDIINAFKNNDKEELEKIKKERISTASTKETARMIFELLTVFVSDPDKSIRNIATRCGFDMNDELDMLLFQSYLDRAQDITNTIPALPCDVRNLEEKYILKLEEFNNEFSKLCEENIEDKSYIRKLKY